MKFDRRDIIGWLISFFAGVAVTAGGMTMLNRTRPAPIVIVPPEATAQPNPTQTPGPIRVYVNGQVAAPAVYELPPGSLVEDAITAAGGWLDDANTVVVNLALPLTDGAQIYVPTLEETASLPNVVVNSLAPPSNSGTVDGAGTGALININEATVEQLDTLPGIGPSTAQKIIDYQNENGRFNTIEEIMNVSGIGEAKYNQIKELITIEGN